MRRNCDERNVYGFFFKNEVIADKVNKNIKHCIGPTAGKIPECPLINPTCKRLVKKINNCKDDISCADQHFNRKTAKIRIWLKPLLIINCTVSPIIFDMLWVFCYVRWKHMTPHLTTKKINLSFQ